MKKRSRMDIYADILEVIKRRPEGALVTRISYGAGLPIDRIKPILETLSNFGLLSIRTAGESRFYHITRRGLEFLEHVQEGARIHDVSRKRTLLVTCRTHVW